MMRAGHGLSLEEQPEARKTRVSMSTPSVGMHAPFEGILWQILPRQRGLIYYDHGECVMPHLDRARELRREDVPSYNRSTRGGYRAILYPPEVSHPETRVFLLVSMLIYH